VDAPSAVINADDFYGARSIRKLHDRLCVARDTDIYDYCMVGYVLENTLTEYGHVARGVCTVTDEGYLSSVVERTRIQRFDTGAKYADGDGAWVDLPLDSTVSMNLWGFTPSLYEELEQRFRVFLEKNIASPKAEYYIPSAVNDLLREGRARVKVLPTGDRWFGVTYQEDKPIVKDAIRALIAKGEYPENLWGR
jgi:hypothetical protein